ncbi:MAG: serine hydrolase, partial [Polaromonas sp.]|nr:serine hydrolase [Polaromonas sp.]
MKPGVLCLALLAVLSAPAYAEADEERLGKAQNYPLGTAVTWYNNPNRVGAWSALDQVPGVRTRTVARAPQASALPVAAQPPAISYRYRNIRYSVADYLERQRATGLLVLKNGEVVAEHYRYGRKDD